MLDPGLTNKPGAMGKPNFHEFEVRIFDDDEAEVAVGETGEIVCRPNGPNLMFAGYWNRPDSMVDATRNLWFHTGDLGRLDEDGFIYFVDRKKDALRRRGENISSFEMEKTLYGHPGLRDVAVHAVPSELGGRREDHRGAARRRQAHRRGAVPVDGRARAVLRDPALRRVP